ncbi:MAG: hypothetical protein AAFN93_18700 [Bacteroidota bacterium]
MRVIKEIPHPACRISVFSWNGKYLIKLEQGPFEQTFKIDELDLTSEEDIDLILNEGFIKKGLDRFKGMFEDLSEAMKDI